MFVDFEKIQEVDLIADTIYKGGNKNNISDEVLSKLMKCENSGGFRKKGSLKDKKLKYIVLYSTGNHSEWNDSYDEETGEFIYFGDQDKPNKEVTDTRKKGNEILRRTFEMLKNGSRKDIAPFFVFVKQEKRDVKFIGLAVPGSKTQNIEDCLVVKETVKAEGVVRNYKAIFTILNIPRINRKWIEDLNNDIGYDSEYAPDKWKKWIEDGYSDIKPKEIIKDNRDSFNDESFILSKLEIDEINEVVDELDSFCFDISYNIESSKDEARNKKEDVELHGKLKSNRDYIEQYIKKQQVGIIGEYIILNHEKEILKNSKEMELIKRANKVEWSSKVHGDGLGYDIKSFAIKDGQVIEKYIEVKTTVGNSKNFEITGAEVRKSKELSVCGLYVIARVFNLDIKNKKADYYYDEGSLDNNYDLEPSVYIAKRKNK